jgi:phosphohistidine phosphatase
MVTLNKSPSARASERSLTVLYILRHGEAEPKGSSKGDELRSLTQVGRAQIRKTVRLAKELGMQIDIVLSSPLTRAQETAKIAGDLLLKEERRIIVEDSLEPDRTPYEIYAALARLSSPRNVLLVSHQPLVSYLLSDLLGIEGSRIAMPTAGMAKILVDGEPSSCSGKLLWLITQN